MTDGCFVSDKVFHFRRCVYLLIKACVFNWRIPRHHTSLQCFFYKRKYFLLIFVKGKYIEEIILLQLMNSKRILFLM